MRRHVKTVRFPVARAAIASGLLLVTLATAAGCGQKRRVDLDRVLATFFMTLQQPLSLDDAAVEAATASIADAATREGKVGAIPETDEKVEADRAMLEDFAARLNTASVHPDRLGTRLEPTGAVIGFTDTNGNLLKDGRDRDLFQIEIDEEGQRVIATDLDDPSVRRDQSYSGYNRYHGGGFWFGYMLGSMNGRSGRHYAANPGTRPNYSGMTMARKGYATQSRSSSRWRGTSSRSRGGSRSFSGGK